MWGQTRTIGAVDLTDDLAETMAGLAIANLGREYPNAPAHLLHGPEDLRPPHELHPAFFGSYDWHSSVHQHWLLARLLRLGRAGSATAAARDTLDRSLTREHLAVEASYLRDHPTFERTYGWAWLLALETELAAMADDGARAWRTALQPAAAVVREHWIGFLGRSSYPIRAGTHANTAFGLLLALDHARAGADRAFADAIERRAREWFAADRSAPIHLEPGGDDFLSPTLVEAALMERVLGPAFGDWLVAYLPDPPDRLLEPATVADRTDPKLVHLDGLNLSRAWCWRRIGPASRWSAAGERAHLAASLPHAVGGDYVATHWVATFALLALTD